MRKRSTYAAGALATIAALAVAFAAPSAAADSVYWSDNNQINRAALSGAGGEVLPVAGGTLGGPAGIAIDSATGRIYWGNETGQISYANLDGSGGGGDLNTAGATVGQPYGAVIDPLARRIYWVNEAANSVSYANLDGSGGGNLNTSGASIDVPEGIALDLEAGRVYWASFFGHMIGYANLDGSGGGILNTGGAEIANPTGVAIDPTTSRLYWTNLSAPSRVAWANLDGSGESGNLAIGAASATNPRGAAIDPEAGRIYWAEEENGGISYANLDGSGGADLNVAPVSVEHSLLPTLQKAPIAVASPSVSGSSVVGAALSCSQGSWAADLPQSLLYRGPSSFSYQWLRDGSEISGATAATYATTQAGSYACRVTATNQAGSATQTSAAVHVSAPSPPSPKARGTAIAAGQAKVKHGSARLRMRCPAAGGDCKGIVKLIVRIKAKHQAPGRATTRGRRVLVGKRAFQIAAGKAKLVRIAINRVGMRQLRHAPHHRLTVRLRGGGVKHRGLQLRLAPSHHR